MASIIDIGFSIPTKRLVDNLYFKATKNHINGERSIADYDEDSITLSCSAADIIVKQSKIEEIQQLIFVSTTPVFGEKLNASVIASALDLGEQIHAYDLTGSTRSQVSAIRIATESVQKKGEMSLIVSGDKKTCAPGSPEEMNTGDAGAAVLIGEKNDGIAVIEDYYSTVFNFIDTWRLAYKKTPDSGELKYSMECGFQNIIIKCLQEFFKSRNIKPETISALVLIAPDGKAQSSIFKQTGIKIGREEADECFKRVGYLGASSPFILLAYMLDRLKEGDRVLLCSYGNGVELVLLRMTGVGSMIKDKLMQQLDKKLILDDYFEFLKLRGVIEQDTIKPFTSIPVLNREEDALLRLHGTRCRRCAAIQYPPRRICWNCSAKDEMDNIKLNKYGKVYTYTKDYVYTSPFPPTVMAVVDLEDGGRFYCQMVDSDKNSIGIGTAVELTLRRMHEGGDFVHYFWKAKELLG